MKVFISTHNLVRYCAFFKADRSNLCEAGTWGMSFAICRSWPDEWRGAGWYSESARPLSYHLLYRPDKVNEFALCVQAFWFIMSLLSPETIYWQGRGMRDECGVVCRHTILRVPWSLHTFWRRNDRKWSSCCASVETDGACLIRPKHTLGVMQLGAIISMLIYFGYKIHPGWANSEVHPGMVAGQSQDTYRL